MNSFKKYPRWIRECWAVFNALRTLGFDSDDIFFVYDAKGNAGVQLKTQGKEFTVLLDNVESISETIAYSMWKQFAEIDIQKFTQEEMNEVWEESAIRARSASFVMAIVQKGIELPHGR